MGSHEPLAPAEGGVTTARANSCEFCFPRGMPEGQGKILMDLEAKRLYPCRREGKALSKQKEKGYKSPSSAKLK